MKKNVRLALTAALLGVVGCDLSSDPVVRNQADDFPLQAEWTASVAGLGTAIAGTTMVRDHRAYYDGEITISNAAPSETYNWRIYPGTCADPGTTIVGGSALAYPPLETNATGSASAQQRFSSHLFLRSNVDYNVRVLTGTTLATTVACGELRRQ